MSKYTTDELSEFLWQLVTVTTSPQQSRDIDARKMNIVIARLRAADELCEAAKELLEVQFVTAGMGYEKGKKVKKAIADYEGGK